MGGPGSDPLIITEPSPITSHSLVSGRHPSPPMAGLTVSSSDHGGTDHISPVAGSVNWGCGRGWEVKESKTDVPLKLMSDAVK